MVVVAEVVQCLRQIIRTCQCAPDRDDFLQACGSFCQPPRLPVRHVQVHQQLGCRKLVAIFLVEWKRVFEEADRLFNPPQLQVCKAGHTQRVASYLNLLVLQQRCGFVDGFQVMPALEVDTRAVEVHHRQVVVVPLYGEQFFGFVDFDFGVVIVIAIDQYRRAYIRQVRVRQPTLAEELVPLQQRFHPALNVVRLRHLIDQRIGWLGKPGDNVMLECFVDLVILLEPARGFDVEAGKQRRILFGKPPLQKVAE